MWISINFAHSLWYYTLLKYGWIYSPENWHKKYAPSWWYLYMKITQIRICIFFFISSLLYSYSIRLQISNQLHNPTNGFCSICGASSLYIHRACYIFFFDVFASVNNLVATTHISTLPTKNAKYENNGKQLAALQQQNWEWKKSSLLLLLSFKCSIEFFVWTLFSSSIHTRVFYMVTNCGYN